MLRIPILSLHYDQKKKYYSLAISCIIVVCSQEEEVRYPTNCRVNIYTRNTVF